MKPRRHVLVRRLLPTLLLSFALSCAAEKPFLSAEAKEELLDATWTTVAEKHFDPTLGGVDWAAAREKARPAVAAARDSEELARALNAMTDALGHSHVGVMAPDDGGEDDEERPSGPGWIGVDAALVEGRVLVVRVREGSPAAAAGIRPGDALLSIDGAPVSVAERRARARNDERTEAYVPYVVERDLAGPVGSVAHLRLESADGALREVGVERVRPPYDAVVFGDLGALAADFESRRLDDGALYVRFRPCMPDGLDRVREAVESAPDAPGVIVDLRGNPGGLGAVAMGVARLFLADAADLGTMRTRQDEIRFRVNPSATPYAGPVAFVVDDSSASTSEILAAGLRALDRVRVVGRPTMGAALPAVVERLPYGWSVLTVVGDFRLPDGRRVEGDGVRPDVEVVPTRAAYAAGRDPFLDAAREALKTAPRLVRARPSTAPVAAAAVAPRKDVVATAEAAAVMDALARAVDPQGRLARAKNQRSTTKVSIMGISGTSESLVDREGRVRTTMSLGPIGETTQVYDGTRCWTADAMQGLRELAPEELGAVRGEAKLDAYGAWRQGYAAVDVVERTRVGERDAVVVKVSPHPGDGDPKTLWIDGATGLPFRIDSSGATNMGVITSKQEILEYRDFDGVRLPYKTKTTVSNGAVISSTLTAVAFDVAVAADAFAKPAEPKARAKPKRAASAPTSRKAA
jgi:carboxyl-terminal processing protease